MPSKKKTKIWLKHGNVYIGKVSLIGSELNDTNMNNRKTQSLKWILTAFPLTKNKS